MVAGARGSGFQTCALSAEVFRVIGSGRSRYIHCVEAFGSCRHWPHSEHICRSGGQVACGKVLSRHAQAARGSCSVELLWKGFPSLPVGHQMLASNATAGGVVGREKQLTRRERSIPPSDGTTCTRRAWFCFACAVSPPQDGTATGSVPCRFSLLLKPPLDLQNPM